MRRIIVSFLMPLPIRNVDAGLLWVFYRQMATLPSSEVVYVGSEGYFLDPADHAVRGRWEVRPESARQYSYRVPSADELAALDKRVVSPDVFGPLLAELPSMNQAWAKLLSAEYPPLVAALREVFEELTRDAVVEAALTWGNCPSLSAAAAQFNIPVIHHELGALRAPQYRPHVYFDFRGVNGNTEAADRYRRFRDESAGLASAVIPREDVLAVASAAANGSTHQPVEFDLGLALQVENDSNVMVFSNGYTNHDLIWTAYQYFPPERVVVRLHPSGFLDYHRLIGPSGHVDHSASATEFVRRCRCVGTINSSVGLEAMLLGRPACILGDSPFRFMSVGQLRGLLDAGAGATAVADAAIGFAVFGYMVPEQFLFDLEYYRWRLTRPSELEIYNRHLRFLSSLREPTPAGLEAPKSG